MVVREPYKNLTGNKHHVTPDVIMEFGVFEPLKHKISKHQLEMKLNLLEHAFNEKSGGGLWMTVQRKGDRLRVQGDYSAIREISNHVTARHNMDGIGVRKID